jgi:shikimate kinase
MNENTPFHLFYLTGIKHSGKSQLGRAATSLIALKNKASFVDIDDLVLKRIAPCFASIRDFYRKEGKVRFMVEEVAALEELLKSLSSTMLEPGPRYHLIATGGGACDNIRLLDLMKASGTIIYLKVEEKALFNRILRDGIPPFLEGPDPSEAFHRLYDERNSKYSNIADFMIELSDSNTIEENSAILAERLLQFVS